MYALRVGIINRYFVKGMLDEMNLTQSVHLISSDHAKETLLFLTYLSELSFFGASKIVAKSLTSFKLHSSSAQVPPAQRQRQITSSKHDLVEDARDMIIRYYRTSPAGLVVANSKPSSISKKRYFPGKVYLRLLHVVHQCHHVVGSHCWSSMVDEQKGKCPVCNVQILCDEKTYVHPIDDRCAPASPNSRGQEPETFLILTLDPPLRAQTLDVEDGEEDHHEEEEIDAFWCFVDLRARIDYIKAGLYLLQGSTKTLTPRRLDRLTRFVADTAHKKAARDRTLMLPCSPVVEHISQWTILERLCLRLRSGSRRTPTQSTTAEE